MRIPVVDSRDVPLMPCPAAKAHHLFKSGKEGWQTKTLREKHGLKKMTSKSEQSFESHTVDSWALAASVSGASQPTCIFLWYVMLFILNRRKLHLLQAMKGGKRRPQGGTRSLGLKRETLVRHTKYGLCTVDGFDRKKQTISLHEYKTNRRVTQGAKVEQCRVLTWIAFRSWLTAVEPIKKQAGKGSHPTPATRKGMPGFPLLKRQGPPQAVR